MTETVFTLGGLQLLRNDRMAEVLGGYAVADGRKHVPIEYPRTASANSILNGAEALDRSLRSRGGKPATVIAASQGAEVVTEWLYQVSGATTRFNVNFILLGNPCRRLGGVVTYGSWLTRYGFLGRRKPTPDTTGYDIQDITRVGDPWSNAEGFPQGKRLRVSIWEILFNKSPHTRYDEVRLDACVLRTRVGNTKYLVSD